MVTIRKKIPTAAYLSNPTQNDYICILELTILSSALHSLYKKGIGKVRFSIGNCVAKIKAPKYSCFLNYICEPQEI